MKEFKKKKRKYEIDTVHAYAGNCRCACGCYYPAGDFNSDDHNQSTHCPKNDCVIL